MTGAGNGERSPRRPARGLSGRLASAVTLGIGALIASVVTAASSPWLAVGGAVVDHSPEVVREFAIDTFGLNDKLALFVGMGLVIAVLAVVAGLAETRRRRYGSMLFAVRSVGVVAALTRPTATVWCAAPTVVGVAAGILTLRLLSSRARPITEDHREGLVHSRRAFVRMAGVAAAVSVAGAATGRFVGEPLRSPAGDRAGFRVPTSEDPGPPVTAAHEVAVPDMTRFIPPTTGSTAWTPSCRSLR